MPRPPRHDRARRRVVLVLGASSGIGRATAHRLAARGDAVVLASRSAEALAEVERECRARRPRRRPVDTGGPDVLVVPTDVSDRAAVHRLFEAAWAAHGHVDAVVHAPAVVAYGRFHEVPADVFDQVIATNLLGTANVAREAMARFSAAGGGHLVVIGSLLGSIATPWMSSYVTSKWAVHGFTRTLQAEARSLPGVEVSLVTPGAVDTPVYAQAGSYARRIGRPPPPVDRPEKHARAIVRVVDRPVRKRSVGPANKVLTAAFRLAPWAYDRGVGPGMSVLGLSRDRVEPHPGNVFTPAPGGEAVHGRWGRHWLRPLGAAAAGLGGLVVGSAVLDAVRSRED
ncbi:SDR family NAD(P)-dependent oxidoreductase [Cellulomonas marina]|uniref:Short-chain dehydrogenase n=1 Tax=Cellulomonas marina TaxID=988821 RepID=A0A1I1AVK6_9CELL|nr:SDR family NAD(P)-dependent oxidoreductase [Cellulomonas marina]GIG30703.1 short-chain dehydrogenase [Cellulomonas marina]SFB42071.1 Short-chain dehydrogenase [Cellulomonas marina]